MCPGEPSVERFGWRFQMRDKVIQTENDYDKDVFNGDVGIVEKVDLVEQQVAVRFDERLVKYDFGELDEISLAYAITIHKSQGSEFPAVVIPLATQHYMLLQRNLIYTGSRGEGGCSCSSGRRRRWGLPSATIVRRGGIRGCSPAYVNRGSQVSLPTRLVQSPARRFHG